MATTIMEPIIPINQKRTLVIGKITDGRSSTKLIKGINSTADLFQHLKKNGKTFQLKFDFEQLDGTIVKDLMLEFESLEDFTLENIKKKCALFQQEEKELKASLAFLKTIESASIYDTMIQNEKTDAPFLGLLESSKEQMGASLPK